MGVYDVARELAGDAGVVYYGSMNSTTETATPLSGFIAHWQNSAAAERANYQLFLTRLCDALDFPPPEAAVADVTKNGYVFERDVTFHNSDGTTSIGRIDLCKLGCFVLEAKQGSEQLTDQEREDAALVGTKRKKKGTAVRGTKGWDDAMLKAKGQAEQYAKALPPEKGWPPFLVVVDVGHTIELFADFTRSGETAKEICRLIRAAFQLDYTGSDRLNLNYLRARARCCCRTRIRFRTRL